jgi:hypothetical protein
MCNSVIYATPAVKGWRNKRTEVRNRREKP